MDTIDFDAYLWSLLGQFPFPWKIELLANEPNNRTIPYGYLISAPNGKCFIKHVLEYETLEEFVRAACSVSSIWTQDVL